MELTGAAAEASSSLSISPNTLYYLALYFLVLIIRFFKIKKLAANTNWTSDQIKKVFHVGLETIYTASGLVVLLLVDLKEYAPFIIIMYLILVLISSQIESMEEKFSENAVFSTHLIILLLVGLVTVWYFESLQKSLEKNNLKVETKEHSTKYHAAIPYFDLSLRNHLGVIFSGKQLVYLVSVEADNAISAKAKAITQFKEEVVPFGGKKSTSESDLIMSDDIYIKQEN